MTEIRKKLGASVLALALALGGLAGAGCVDHSGDKTFPRPDAGVDTSADTEQDAPAQDDAPATGDASDAPAASDTPAAETHPDTGTSADTGTSVDVRLDGTGG